MAKGLGWIWGRRGAAAFSYNIVLATTVVLSVVIDGGPPQELWRSAPMTAHLARQMVDTADATPARVLLVPRRNLIADTPVTANTIRLSGITVPVGVAVTEGAELSVNNGPFGPGPMVAERGQPIVVRATAPAAGQSRQVELTTGDVVSPWVLTSLEAPGHTHQILHGPWGACDADQPCDGTGTQSRDILCLRSDGRFVDVGLCGAGLATSQARSCPSPAGTAACVPRPALALGTPTQYCAAGSSVRGVCTGFTCPEPYVAEGGACVSTVQGLPVLSVSGPTSVGEGAGSLTLTLTASYPVAQAVSVPVTLTAASTASAADFGPIGVLDLEVGAQQASLTIALQDDTLAEATETAVFAFDNPAGGASFAPGSASLAVQILDNDRRPSVSLGTNRIWITEGSDPAQITVMLDEPATRDIDVPLVLSGATDDATLSPTIARIATGQTQAVVELAAVQDTLDEPEEVVTVALGLLDPAVVTAGPVTQILMPVRDDDVPMLAFAGPATVTVAEGSVIDLPLWLDQAPVEAGHVVIDVHVTSTASASDYVVPARIDFAPGDRIGSLRLSAVADGLDEPSETVVLTLGGGSNWRFPADTAARTRTVTITDGDVPVVSLSADAATMPETGGSVRITATLDRASWQEIRVPVTLTAGVGDATLGGTQFVFPAGQLTSAVTLTATADLVAEANEAITVALGAASLGEVALGTATVTVTLIDDDYGLGTLGGATAWQTANGTWAYAERCQAYRNPPAGFAAAAANADGTYWLDPDGAGTLLAPFRAYCDMTDTDGWTLLAYNNQTTTFSTANFDRVWADYKNGFLAPANGTLGLGWVGNDRIHWMTRTNPILEVRTTGSSGARTHRYNFLIGNESQNYQLSLGTRADGNDSTATGFVYHNGRPFSTRDRDLDTWPSNCASHFRAGWWHGDCYNATIAGNNRGQVYWRDGAGNWYHVTTIGMWIN